MLTRDDFVRLSKLALENVIETAIFALTCLYFNQPTDVVWRTVVDVVWSTEAVSKKVVRFAKVLVRLVKKKTVLLMQVIDFIKDCSAVQMPY